MENNKEQEEKMNGEVLQKTEGEVQSSTTQEDKDTNKAENGKKKKVKWIIIAVVAVIFILLAAGYCSIAVYYQTHFFKNTSINNVNCGDMEASAIASILDSQANEFGIEIIGRDENGQEVSLGTVQAGEMGYAYTDTFNAVNAILEQQNEWLWITTLGEDVRGYSLVQGVTYDSQMLRDKLVSLDAFQKKNMIAPKDAYISEYSEAAEGYEVIPETIGTEFDVEQAISLVETAIVGNSHAQKVIVNLVEEGCYAEPKVTADDKALISNVETINKWLSTQIIYDWNSNEVVVDNSVIKEWAFFEDGKPVLDEEAIAAFVNKNANDYDTSGKYTTFTTTLGVQLNLPRLSYGWKTDREGEIAELTKLIKAGSKQEREPLYIRKGVWKGQNDIGNSYIEADITHQHLYVYDKGVIVFETDFVSGDMNKPDCVSPAGVFALTYKTLNAVLRGADYVTPVTYWMPFYGNFGMHDATWRDSFGGEIYLTDGSHGCLNLPLDAAAVIYNYVYEGSPIICYYY